MKIKLLKPACNRAAGTIIEVNDDHAGILIGQKYAEPAPVEVHTKAIGGTDSKKMNLADVSRAMKKNQ